MKEDIIIQGETAIEWLFKTFRECLFNIQNIISRIKRRSGELGGQTGGYREATQGVGICLGELSWVGKFKNDTTTHRFRDIKGFMKIW